MPSTATHDLIGLVTAIPVGAVGAIAGGAEFGVLLGASYVVSTFVLSPDLDWGKNGKQGRVAQRWGLLSWIWYPYHWLVPHRSKVSHSALGAVLRLAYVAIMIYALVVMLGISIVWHLSASIIVPITIGSMAASSAHSITDNIVTGYKRSLRPRRRR